MTFGNSTFRLYDLNTGDFINQDLEKLNVNIGASPGISMITGMLYI
ncbi:hypothetical protein [Chryseobacterium sp. Mn2064]